MHPWLPVGYSDLSPATVHLIHLANCQLYRLGPLSDTFWKERVEEGRSYGPAHTPDYTVLRVANAMLLINESTHRTSSDLQRILVSPAKQRRGTVASLPRKGDDGCYAANETDCRMEGRGSLHIWLVTTPWLRLVVRIGSTEAVMGEMQPSLIYLRTQPSLAIFLFFLVHGSIALFLVGYSALIYSFWPSTEGILGVEGGIRNPPGLIRNLYACLQAMRAG